MKYYGETEFWLALGKMLLIIGLICYTFVVMLGGNPLKDRFGFRFWKDPGSFNEKYYTGDLGRWLGFLQCLIQASFTIAGPDYVAMAAGEAENPRYIMPRAFKAVFYRLMFFFVIGSLCVGIVVPSNDPEMNDAFLNDKPGAAGSPYVASMNRLKIPVLPHIVNAMVLGSAFSAGNSYAYCASRSLYGMALEGKAPKLFTRCTRNGVPIFAVASVLLISLLAFLQLNSGSATVLNWFVSLVSPSLHMLDTLLIKSDHRLPTHQLLRHDLHLPEMEESLRSPRPRSQHSRLYRMVVTIHRLLRLDGNHDHDLRWRLYRLLTWFLGHPDIPVQLHHGRSLSDTVCRLEIDQEDQVAGSS